MNVPTEAQPAAEKPTSYAASKLLQKVEEGRLILDCSLEAFLKGLQGDAQAAHGAGGLGFLAGETYGAYEEAGVNGIGCIPGYGTLQKGAASYEVDWGKSGAVPLIDADGHHITCDVQMNNVTYRTEFWVVEEGGTPVIMIRQPQIFHVRYPDDSAEKLKQYMFFGRAVVEMCKRLRINPSIVRINEAQLAPVLMTISRHREDTKSEVGSILGSTRMVLTNHTQERAALPSWANREWVEKHIGSGVIPEDAWSYLSEDHPIVKNDLVSGHCTSPVREGEGGRKYYEYLSPLNYALFVSAAVNGVSKEHGTISSEIIFPSQAPDQRLSEKVKGKLLTITNGSDRRRWTSPALRKKQEEHFARSGNIDDVMGEELLAARSETKEELNRFLEANGLPALENTAGRPLIALTRRHVAYKEIGTLIPLIQWMCGEKGKEYSVPGGEKKFGLGANVLIGGVASDPEGREWQKQFETLQELPELKGRFVFAPRTGIEFMRLCTGSADFWIHGPRQSREACGTSYERAVFSGGWNICTATGGPMEHVQDGKNGSIVNLFPEMDPRIVAEIFDRAKIEHPPGSKIFIEEPGKQALIEEFQKRWQQYLLQKLPELVEKYGNSDTAASMAKDVYRTSETMDIVAMAHRYRALYEAVMDGTVADKITDGTLTPAQPFPRFAGAVASV